MECNICGAEVEEDDQEDHVTEVHSARVDDELQEFLADATQRVVEECFGNHPS